MRISFLLIAFMFATLPGCIIVSDSITVPHANFKLEVPLNSSKQSILNSIDESLHSLGFKLLENDWEVWKPILENDQLVEKQRERRYENGDLEISFSELFTSKNDGFIRLSYYEKESRQFSDLGIEVYYKIHDQLLKVGLVHLEESDEDVKASRPLVTPEEFNRSYPKPRLIETVKYVAMVALGLIFYILFVLMPGWLLIRRMLRKVGVECANSKLIFATIVSLLLFPAPIPISMFGPMLLAPGIFILPFIFGIPEQMQVAILLSMGVTWVISLLAALWLLKSGPNKQIKPTPGGAA